MHIPKPPLGRILFALLTASMVSAAEPAWRSLFNGHDLAGWETWLGRAHPSIDVPGEAKEANGNYAAVIGTNRDPLGVITVVSADDQPAIRITGQVFGGLHTTEEFTNYHLRLQFKWGEAKWAPRETAVRDSGLLYHVHSEWNYSGRTWPRAPELQIQEHDTGDLFAIGCQMTVLARRLDPTRRLFQYDPVNGVPTDFLEQPPVGNRCIKDPDNENPTGEWNTVELICLGDESIHIVNGKVVMRLTKARRLDGAAPVPLTAGRILLQSEGAEVFYRNIEIRPITVVPAEYAGE